MSNPVPGWYADPAGTPQLRWWDGNQWTEQYRPNGAEAATQPALSDSSASASGSAATGIPAAQQAPVPRYTPVAATPRTKATGGQILVASIASVLAVIFAIASLVTSAMYVEANKAHDRSKGYLEQAQQELQKAQEDAK